MRSVLPKQLLLGLLLLAPFGVGDEVWPAVVSVNKDRTVLIRVSMNGHPPGYGSGLLLSSKFILTAKHLLPVPPIVSAQSVLIEGLIGWSNASIDFTKSRRMSIRYVSDRYDLAILDLDSPVSDLKFPTPLWEEDPRQGQRLLVMGYPDGGSLDCTGGLASGEAGDGEYRTDSSVGTGFSGGPVFSASGGLLGILLEGSGRDNAGVARRGFFLRSSIIAEELRRAGGDGPSSLPNLVQPPLEAIVVNKALPGVHFSYTVDDEKVDHPALLASSDRTFEHSFDALPGYVISTARFVSASANHVSVGPSVEVAKDGTHATIRYTLQSGPLIDQWRGWIVGSLVTEQKQKFRMTYALRPSIVGLLR